MKILALIGMVSLTIALNQTLPSPYALPNIGGLKDGSSIATVGRYSFTTTQLVVTFRDYAGATVSTASADMDFTVDFDLDVLAETPLGVVNISRANCKLNMNDVYGGSSNIWGFGAHIR